jgi:16S rRNA (guanine527-N7)-methyltransferase
VDRIRRDAESMGLSLPHGAAERLSEYAALLVDRAVPLGLVARSDAARVYQRHVLDSLRASTLVHPGDRLAYDLGSGAGIPGVVVAAATPWCRVVLVEPRRIRVGFLEMALERLGLPNAEIAPVQADDLDDPADVVMARAFATLPRTWQVAGRLLRPGGRLIYFAGESLVDPVETARAAARRGLPATVETAPVLATSRPLVIMTRT